MKESPEQINSIFFAVDEEKKLQGSLKEIFSLARQNNLVCKKVPKKKLDDLLEEDNIKNANHQGIVAMISPIEYQSLDEILEKGTQKILLLCDGIQDPHNLGAILRTAEAVKIDGVLLPKRRNCQLSSTVAKTSAGALAYLPVARVGNVVQTIQQLKEKNFWIVGADLNEKAQPLYQADLTGSIVLVVGNEGKGLSRLTKEHCDFFVKIPMLGNIQSLNVSVATSVILYEILRQRNFK